MPSMQLIQLLVATEGQQAHGQELLLSMRILQENAPVRLPTVFRCLQ